MAKPVFDPSKKYSTIFGNSLAKFYQDGHHFKATGEYVPWDMASRDARKPDVEVPGNTEHQFIKQEQKRARLRVPEQGKTTTVGRDKPPENHSYIGVKDKVATEPPTTTHLDESEDPRFDVLKKKTFSQLKKMVESIKETQDVESLSVAERVDFEAHPAKGTGSSEKNARFIIRWSR